MIDTKGPWSYFHRGSFSLNSIVLHKYCSIVLHKAQFAYDDFTILIGFTALVGEFDILDKNTSTQGVAYDYKSVMHPCLSEFGKYKKKTIVPLNLTRPFYSARHPSTLDIFHIRITYCEGNYMYM